MLYIIVKYMLLKLIAKYILNAIIQAILLSMTTSITNLHIFFLIYYYIQ
jgi:hypothetical protein